MATRLSTRSCGLYKILVRFGEHSILVCYKTLALRGFVIIGAHFSCIGRLGTFAAQRALAGRQATRDSSDRAPRLDKGLLPV